MDLNEVAGALVGVRIGGVPLTWEEALLLAQRVITRASCDCGKKPTKTIKQMMDSIRPPSR